MFFIEINVYNFKIYFRFININFRDVAISDYSNEDD